MSRNTTDSTERNRIEGTNDVRRIADKAGSKVLHESYDGGYKLARPENIPLARILGQLRRAGYTVMSIDWDAGQFRVIPESEVAADE